MRFYLKRGGWGWSVYHRATHCYLAGFDSMEEAAEFIEKMNKMTPKEFWRHLIFEKRVKVPHKDVLKGVRKDPYYEEQEKGYESAWKYGTEEFYERYPHLLVEDDRINYDLINQVKAEEYERQAREMEEERKRNLSHMRKIFRRIENGIIKLIVHKRKRA